MPPSDVSPTKKHADVTRVNFLIEDIKYMATSKPLSKGTLENNLGRVMGVIHRDWKNPGRSIHLRCISNLRGFFWPIITLLVSKERSWSLDVIFGLKRPIISIIKIFTINHKKNLAVKFYPLFFTHFAMEITTWKIHISVWLLL